MLIELVEWLEEVQKALQGYLINDEGRMINGLFGLTFGLFNIIRVQKGILVKSDNTFYNQVVNYYGKESKFAELSDKAFGINISLNLSQRVKSGLKLFLYVVEDMEEIFEEKDKEIIMNIKEKVEKHFGIGNKY